MTEEHSSSSSFRLISQGAYGCVYKPGLACTGEPLKKNADKYLTKLQEDHGYVQNEEFVSNLIRTQIKDYRSVAAPVLRTCRVTLRERALVEKVGSCRAIRQQRWRLKEALLEKKRKELKDGVDMFLQKIRFVEGPLLDKHLVSPTTSSSSALSPQDAIEKWVDLLTCHLYLVDSVAKLQQQGIVHYDLKPNNVLFDTTQEVPILIDFGLSIHVPSLDYTTNAGHAFYSYGNYFYWPLEVCVLSYLFEERKEQQEQQNDTVQQNDIDRITSVFAHGHPSHPERPVNEALSSKLFEPPLLPDVETAFNAYLATKFVGKPWRAVYDDLLSLHGTWDLYALAVGFLTIVEEMPPSWRIGTHCSKSYQAYVAFLRTTIGAMPHERPNMDATREALRGIKALVRKG